MNAGNSYPLELPSWPPPNFGRYETRLAPWASYYQVPPYAAYAEAMFLQGLDPVRLGEGSKFPAHRTIFADRPLTKRHIRQWVKRHPWGNYGLRLGHPIGDTGNYLVVFDEDGAEAHAHLLKIFGGVVPPTFCVRTRRGMHLYFLTPNRYGSARIRPDLDFKASANQYVVGPGSTVVRGLDEYAERAFVRKRWKEVHHAVRAADFFGRFEPWFFTYDVIDPSPIAQLPAHVAKLLDDEGRRARPPRPSLTSKRRPRTQQGMDRWMFRVAGNLAGRPDAVPAWIDQARECTRRGWKVPVEDDLYVKNVAGALFRDCYGHEKKTSSASPGPIVPPATAPPPSPTELLPSAASPLPASPPSFTPPDPLNIDGCSVTKPITSLASWVRSVRARSPGRILNLAEGQRSYRIQAEFFSVATIAHAVPEELHAALFAPLLDAAYRRADMAAERGDAPMTHAEVNANLRCALRAGAAKPRQVLSLGDLGAALGGSGLSTSPPPAQGDTPGHPEECGMRTCEECGTLYRYGQALRTGEWYLIPERSHSPLAKRLRRRGAGGLPLPRSDGEVILVNTPSEGGVLVPDPYSYVQESLPLIPSHHKVRPIAVFPSAKRRTSGRCRGRYQPDVPAEVLYPPTTTPMREAGSREDKSTSITRPPTTHPPPPHPATAPASLIVPRSTPGRRPDFRRGMPNPRKTPAAPLHRRTPVVAVWSVRQLSGRPGTAQPLRAVTPK